MDNFINNFVERINDLLEKWPGLLPLLGIALIVVNLLLQIIPGSGTWLVDSHFFLHAGIIVSVIGLLLVSVYRH